MWALCLNLAFKVNRQVQAQKGAPAIQQKTSITRPDMWRVSLTVLFLLFGAGLPSPESGSLSAIRKITEYTLGQGTDRAFSHLTPLKALFLGCESGLGDAVAVECGLLLQGGDDAFAGQGVFGA